MGRGYLCIWCYRCSKSDYRKRIMHQGMTCRVPLRADARVPGSGRHSTRRACRRSSHVRKRKFSPRRRSGSRRIKQGYQAEWRNGFHDDVPVAEQRWATRIVRLLTPVSRAFFWKLRLPPRAVSVDALAAPPVERACHSCVSKKVDFLTRRARN